MRDGLIQIGGSVASIVGVEGAVDVWVGGVDVVSGGSDDGIVQHLHDQNKEKRGEGASLFHPFLELDFGGWCALECCDCLEVVDKVFDSVDGGEGKLDVVE